MATEFSLVFAVTVGSPLETQFLDSQTLLRSLYLVVSTSSDLQVFLSLGIEKVRGSHT
jgi:hypothetical protein